jgi:hypothetical protein
MIQPRELRIGNYVKLNNTEYMPDVVGQIGTVTKLTEKIDCRFPNSTGTVEVRVGLNEYHQFSEFIEPIELTEEWLVRFGCSNIKGHDCWFINYFGFCLTHDGEDWCLKPRADEPYLICYIKYVHEFQNIYFALSMEELTLTN